MIGLVAINRVKIEDRRSRTRHPSKKSRAEVIDLPSLCREVREFHQFSERRVGLHVCTQMALPRLYGYCDVRILFVGTYPCSIESDPQRVMLMAAPWAVVLDDVNPCLPRFGLRRCMLRVVKLHIVADAHGAASRWRNGRRVLCNC